MNILCVIHELARNGAVVCLLDAARHFRAQGHKVTIFVDGPEPTWQDSLRGEFDAIGAAVIRQADGEAYDLAIVCTLINWRWVMRFKGKFPIAWWVHEGTAVAKRFLGEQGFRQALESADQFLFPSPNADKMFAPLFGDIPPERRSIVPPVIPPPAAVPPAAKDEGRFRIVTVGTLCPRKRQSDLLAAIASLPDLPIDCVLIGEKSMVDPELSDRMAALGAQVIAPGGLGVAEVQSYYRSADLFCLPSTDEHFPMAPLEASLHRVPVLLSNLKCYEGVWAHGQNALLHPVGDKLLLATYLRALFVTPELCQRLGETAHRSALGYTEARFATALELAIAATFERGSQRNGHGPEAPKRVSGWRRLLGLQERPSTEPAPEPVAPPVTIEIAEPPTSKAANAPGSLPPPAPEIAELHAQVLALVGTGDMIKAADLLRQALSRAPGDLRCLVTGTMVFTFLRDLAQAEEFGRQAVKEGPEIPAVHVNLGNCLFEQGRSKEALASFRQALELRPDLPAALLNCGHCCATMGEADRAADYFEAVRAAAADDSTVLAAAGRGYLGIGRLAEAEDCLTRCMELGGMDGQMEADLARVRSLLSVSAAARSEPLSMTIKRDLVFSLGRRPEAE